MALPADAPVNVCAAALAIVDAAMPIATIPDSSNRCDIAVPLPSLRFDHCRLYMRTGDRSGRPALLRGHAAVQGKDGAGGEAAFVAGKKQDAVRDLLRRAEPAEQLPRRQRLARGGGIDAFLENFVEIGRVDRAWRDRVATDAVADVIDGDGARQRRHRP